MGNVLICTFKCAPLFLLIFLITPQDNETPLHYCAKSTCGTAVATAELLLAAGAAVEAQDKVVPVQMHLMLIGHCFIFSNALQLSCTACCKMYP
jgi:hypothetical protein